MITLITTYKGINIFEEYGYYFPSVDPSIDSSRMGDILKWIDEFLFSPNRVNISYSIMSDYFQTLPYKYN